MKIIKTDKKKSGVAIILFGLMIILFAFAGYLNDRVSYTMLVPYQWGPLKDYHGLNGSLNYKLPKDWDTSFKDLSSMDILYHNEFISPGFTVHGFVQAWRLNRDLKTFLIKSKEFSEKQNTIKNYKLDAVKINQSEGFFVTYIIETKNNTDYRALEYFIKNNNGFIRFSFYMKDSFYKENMKASFENIVKTLNYTEVSEDERKLTKIPLYLILDEVL